MRQRCRRRVLTSICGIVFARNMVLQHRHRVTLQLHAHVHFRQSCIHYSRVDAHAVGIHSGSRRRCCTQATHTEVSTTHDRLLRNVADAILANTMSQTPQWSERSIAQAADTPPVREFEEPMTVPKHLTPLIPRIRDQGGVRGRR
jgi:hypothetical protein